MFPDPSQSFYGIIAFQQEEQLLWKGYAPGGNLPTLETQYRIASITKTFIGAAFSKLAEQGLDLRTTVDELLPSFTHPCAGQITLQHLLCHRSGLAGFKTDGFGEPFHELPRSLEWLVTQVSRIPLQCAPDTSSIYSPPGYVLLGAILEKYTKQSCSQWLERNFFTPFNLRNTHFHPQGTMDESRKECQTLPKTHLWKDNKISPLQSHRDFSTSHASGAIISTAQDLLNWADVLLIRKIVMGNEDLSAMLHDYGQGFGYGVCVGTSGKYPVYYHFGSTSGISSVLITCPTTKTSLCILSHVQDYPITKLAKEIWPHVAFHRLNFIT
jgi:CubicO group peptidase (beta-lactamase class C family)